MGAVRTGKTVKYLTEFGHDVRVISADDQNLPKDLALEINKEKVLYTKWFDINFLPTALLGKQKVVTRGFDISNQSALGYLGNLYREIFNFPDGKAGWYPFALRTGRKIIKEWKPDIIFASAMPYTGLLVASKLSKETGIPWIAELRDLWTDNHYASHYKIRSIIEKRVEAKTLKTAAGLVTVSQPLANILNEKYRKKPVKVVLNGFDDSDYRFTSEEIEEAKKRLGVDTFNICYTGMIYQGRQDPSQLFKALETINSNVPIRVHFWGRYLGIVNHLSSIYGKEKQVFVHEPISYRQSLCVQSQADLLLLLLWNDPREKGVYTGKLFEYIGAGKKILAIGPKDNVAAQLIKERNLGIVTNEIDEIREFILETYNQKDNSINGAFNLDLTRRAQTVELEKLFIEILSHHNLTSKKRAIAETP